VTRAGSPRPVVRIARRVVGLAALALLLCLGAARPAHAQKAAVLVGGPVLPEAREIIAAAARGRIVDQRWKLVEPPPMPEMDLHDILTCVNGAITPGCTKDVRQSTPVERLLVLSARNEGSRTTYSTVVNAWLLDGTGALVVARSKICPSHCKPGFLETAVNELVSSILKEADDKLRPTVLAIRSTPEGADVEVDGETVGATNLDHAVTPGPHRVVVRKEGFEPVTREVVAVERQTIAVEVELQAEAGILDGPRNPIYGYIGAGVGAALLGAGAYLVITDEDAADGNQDGNLSAYNDTAPLGVALGAAGLAVAGAGLAWLLLPELGETEPAGPLIGVGQHGAWLGFAGRF
jgi:hypothetical protein